MGISAKPDLCYEFNNSGVDAAGNGPGLNLGTYGAGLLAQALDNNVAATVSQNPGVGLTGNFTINLWREIDGGSLAAADDELIGSAEFAKLGDYSYTFIVAGSGEAAGVKLTLGASVATSTVAEGWHLFSAVRTSGLVQFYIDGVAVGTPAAVANGSASNEVTITNGDVGQGRLDQVSVREAAYSAADLLYLFQSQAGIAYSAMVLNTVPATLTLRLTSSDAKTMSVDWDAPADGGAALVRYGVYRSVNGSSFTLFDNIPATATTYSYSTGERSVTHALKVAAVNSAGTATLSNSQGVL